MTTTVKVLNAEKVIGTHQIPKDNVLVLKAENNVNYQLVNDATGFGPQNILTKREGNNLVISLEDGDTRPDLIIEDYYSNKGATNLIVGLHENGQIYAYVPESGKVAESISVLAEEVVAPQALGGTELAVPFWSFNPWWLAGAAAVVGGVAALAAGGSSKKASVATTTAPKLQASENGDLEVLPADGNRTVTVDFLNKQGQQQVIKIERVGNEWRIVEPADTTLPNYVQFDSTTGKITIDPSEVGGDGKVNVSATEPGKIDSSQKDVTNNTQLTAEKPDVEPTGNGGKTVSPKNNTKEMSINFTNEQGQPQTVVVEKVNGVWQLKNGGTLPQGVNLNNQTGEVTLDPQLLGDSTPISVEGKEDGKVDAVVNGVTDGDQNAAPPPVRALADGGVEFSPAVGNTEVYAEFFNEDNVKQTVTIVQDTNGNWVLKPGTTKPEGVTIDSNGTVTVDSQAIQDKSKITAIGREAGKNEAPNDATSSAVDTAPAQPKVLPKESGGIDIIPAAGNDEVTVEIPNEKGGRDPISIKKVGNDWLPVVNGDTLPKSENGNYSELPKGITVDPKTGKISVDPQAVADNAEIIATATENGKTGAAQKTASTIDDKNAAQPKVEAKDDGSVVATPETGNELMEVKYHSEGNTGTDPDKTVTVKKVGDDWVPVVNGQALPKSDNGEYSQLPGVKVDPATGKVTLDPQSVKDGSEVTATGKETKADGSPKTDAVATPANAEEDDVAGKPTVSPKDDGAVEVTPSADNEEMEVKYHSEGNTGTDPDKTVTVKKVGDDWVPVVDGQPLTKSTSGEYPQLPGVKVDPATGKVTLDPQSVKDGSEVTATGKETKADGSPKTDAVATPANAEEDDVAGKPTVSPKDDGAVEVTPSADNEEMEVKYHSEGNTGTDPDKTVTVKKVGDDSVPVVDGQPLTKSTSGEYPQLPGVKVDPVTGKVTLDPQSVKDGSEVTATGKETKADGSPKTDAVATPANAEEDDVAGKPTVSPKDDGAVEVTPSADNEEMEVKYHSEGNTGTDPDKTVTVKKVGDDWVPVVNGQALPKSDNGEYSQLPGVKVDPATGKVTLDPQSVKDGSEVTATGKETKADGSPKTDAVATPANAEEDDVAGKPTVSPKDDGAVEVTPSADNEEMEVKYHSEGNTGTDPDKTVTVKKVGDDWVPVVDGQPLTKSTSGEYPQLPGVKVDPVTGKVTLDPQSVKDGSEVTATGKETKADGSPKTDAVATPANAEEDDVAGKPTVSPKDDGAVEVTPSADNEEMEVKYHSEGNTGTDPDKTVTVKKVGDDWVPVVDGQPLTKSTSGEYPQLPGVKVDPVTGKVTLDPQSVKDGSEVTATGKETKADGSPKTDAVATPANAEEDDVAGKPTVSPKDDGAVEVTPSADNEEMEVKYHSEGNTGTDPDKTVTVKKVGDDWVPVVDGQPLTKSTSGEYPQLPGVKVDPVTGKVTLDPQSVKDGSEVTATGKETKADGSPKTDAVATPANAEEDDVAGKPTVSPKDDGAVEVTPSADNEEMEVKYHSEGNTGTDPDKTVTVKKVGDDWVPVVDGQPLTKSTSGEYPQLPGVKVDPVTGKVTLDPQSVKDGSEVTATGKETKADGSPKTDAVATPANAEEDDVAGKPTVSPKDDGAVEVTPSADNEEMEVKYHSEGNTGTDPDKTVTVKKVGDDSVPVVDGQPLTKSTSGEYPQLPGVKVDPVTGKVTLDPQSVKDGSEVTATGKETKADGSPKTDAVATPANAEEDDVAGKPTVSPKDDGAVEVTPSADNEEMEVKYHSEGNTGTDPDKTVTVKKVGDDWVPVVDGQPLTKSTSGEYPQLPGVKVDPATGKVTLDPQSVKDGSEVTATGKETKADGSPKTDAVATPANAEEDDVAGKPTVSPKDDGAVEVTPSADNEEMEVKYHSEGNTGTDPDKTVTVKKVGDDWVPVVDGQPLTKSTSGEYPQLPGVKVDPVTGKVTLDPQSVKDGSEVTATGKETKADGSPKTDAVATPANAEEDDVAGKPTVSPKDDGAVEVTPSADNEEMEVKYHSEGNTGTDPDKTVTVKKVGDDWVPVVNGQALPKSDNGEYSQLPGVKVDPVTGKVTLDPQSVKDGSEVTATGKETKADGSPKTDAVATPANAEEDDVAGKPTVSPKDDGAVEVTPSADNEEMEVKYHSEGNTGTDPDKTVTVKKVGDDWVPVVDGQPLPKSTNGDYSQLPGVKVDPVTGKVTLDPQSVKDGSEVTATGKETKADGSPKTDAVATGQAKSDGTAGEPTVVTDPTGPVSATPNATNDLMEVKYHSEDNTGTEPNKTVTVKKVGNDWVPVVDGQTLPKSDTGVYTELPNVKVDPVTGKVTLDKELVKDGSQVTVTVTEGRKDPVTKTDNSGYDEVPQPDIVANADKGFDVTPKPQNVEMTARFTNERDQPQDVTIKKEGDEWFFPVEVTSNKDNATVPEPALLFKNKDGQWMAKGTGGQPDKPATSAQIAALPQEVRDGNVTLEQSSGKLSIDGQAIKDGTKVSVTAKDAADRTSTPKESDNPAPNDGTAASPNITTTENGGVKVKPAANSKELEVKFHSENNPDGAQPNQTVTAVLDETTGKWKPKDGTKLPKGVTLNSTTGEIELKPHAVKDKSEVTATATETALTKPASVTGIAPEDTGPASTESATEADPAKNINPGDTVIRPADDTKTIDVTYVNKAGETKTVKVTKNGNGDWSKSGDTDADGLKFDPTDGTLVIPTEKLKGGSEVTYVTYTDTDPSDKYTRKTPAALQVEQSNFGGRVDGVGGMKVNASKKDVSLEVQMESESNNKYTLKFERTSETSTDWKLKEVVLTDTGTSVYTDGQTANVPDDLRRKIVTRDAQGTKVETVDAFTINGEGVVEFHPNALKDSSDVVSKGTTANGDSEFQIGKTGANDYVPGGAGSTQVAGSHYVFDVQGTFWAAPADDSMPQLPRYDGVGSNAKATGEYENNPLLGISYIPLGGTETDRKTVYVGRPRGPNRANYNKVADLFEKNADGSWNDIGDIDPQIGKTNGLVSLDNTAKAYINQNLIEAGSLKLFMDTGYSTKDIVV